MSSSDNVALFYSLLTDSWTFYLTFCGILISVITLLYSFILGKKAELKVYAEQAKLGNNDPMLKKKQRAAVVYIGKLASINEWCVLLLCISFLSCVTSWGCIRFMPTDFFFIILLIIGVITLFITASTIVLIIKLFLQYRDDIKL